MQCAEFLRRESSLWNEFGKYHYNNFAHIIAKKQYLIKEKRLLPGLAAVLLNKTSHQQADTFELSTDTPLLTGTFFTFRHKTFFKTKIVPDDILVICLQIFIHFLCTRVCGCDLRVFLKLYSSQSFKRLDRHIMTMNQEIDKELLHVMLEILQAALSSDKNLIDSAQQQLKVLQVRSGKTHIVSFYYIVYDFFSFFTQSTL